ncbi:hypothetical protein QBC33DRAFT_361627 [Phialemonium atrogriseum]|uniref:Uncharacterized protein n=1 Tax=Phialemonium atrogriseum TaxID=1093897 RepID=A0AAJ0FHQ0_9PEZI|nr:uncharacterized protein QBC33DRAFT_361627 [Phialemonium atrogriseum]KAK1768821.1 hypothetical protein QBC33DRAFT_361627 [Phialemonium atrogriseum]
MTGLRYVDLGLCQLVALQGTAMGQQLRDAEPWNGVILFRLQTAGVLVKSIIEKQVPDLQRLHLHGGTQSLPSQAVAGHYPNLKKLQITLSPTGYRMDEFGTMSAIAVRKPKRISRR